MTKIGLNGRAIIPSSWASAASVATIATRSWAAQERLSPPLC